MKRDRLKDLHHWRNDQYRKPLVLRGCRQVGKSWLVREFGKQFVQFIEINFEKNKLIHQYFSENLNIHILLEKLSIQTGVKIKAGTTLLFFDEIQACEGALQSLRYFKEEMPELHVIAAGSLLDFSLNALGIPVGRVQFMHLYPLSFGEYLTAVGQQELRNFLFKQENDPVIHQQLLAHVKDYMWLGGMPAVVDAWIKDKDYIICQRIQDEMIESYQIDFYKYAKQREISNVTMVFQAIPKLLGKKFIYSNVDHELRTETVKKALLLLEAAGIAKLCYHTSAQRPPLGAEVNQKKFKVFYFDIGIAQRVLGLDVKRWVLNPILIANQGSIAEQFCAQEILAYSDAHKSNQLYYWHREAKSSNAEVDLIIVKNGQIVPVEIKSSEKGSMKSMHLFLNAHLNSKYGLKISQGKFAKHGQIQEIPLYAIESWLEQE